MVVVDDIGHILVNTNRGVCQAEDRLMNIYVNIAFEVLGSVGEKLNPLHVEAIKYTVKKQIGLVTER